MAGPRRIGLGIIGGGLMGKEVASAIARWCHLVDSPVRPELVAICSVPAETLTWFTDYFPSISQATTDYHALLANPKVDAVYCAVPHAMHERFYIDTIRAGKHLLGEKPFGIDQKANAAISKAIAENPKLVVRCSSEFPYFPGVQRMVEAWRAGRFGRVLEVEAGFLHSSDMDPNKPINWKRQVSQNGEYGCMGDLGMHVWHVPLRFGWFPKNVRAILSNIVPQRPDGKGGVAACDTWDNATLLCEVEHAGYRFPLTAKTQRIAPGQTDTWYLSIIGDRYSARFTTKKPRTLESMSYEPGGAQVWQSEDLGYASTYKAITGHIFEFGFSDAILQMLAAFFDQVAQGPAAELPFGCVSPAEAAGTHAIFTAALASQKQGQVVSVNRG
ncbi:MAG: Gfo/Idh/MocA family oxidoreductase [Phycisphaeraceae bacterium]|nr:Gfo/Idh/MocA family oxidoreductase [Phycisphaeraceae bacterium]